MGDGKYYWLRLKRDFFKRHDIRIIEDMANGKDYILFYLKLLCESVDHDGNLRFSEQIPYNDQMLATITNTNIDIVRSAIKVFSELGMMELLDDGTFFMNEVQRMIGYETEWAAKKREYRKKISDKGQSEDIVRTKLPIVRQEKELEIDKETYISKKKSIKKKYGVGDNVLLTDEEYAKLQERFPDCQERIDRLSYYIGSTGKRYKSHYMTILSWAEKDDKKKEGRLDWIDNVRMDDLS